MMHVDEMEIKQMREGRWDNVNAEACRGGGGGWCGG
jgi:hypothetical protein